MAKKQFKAESKKLLDLMINSIYTHKEIFLRELISNASDAIDKLLYLSLTDGSSGLSRADFKIRLIIDRENRTLTVSDNGIGMSRADMEENLGVIARSGSEDFKRSLSDAEEAPEDIDIIGRFGVGFYSSFMVSDKVTVVSRAHGSDEAFKWESAGSDGYTVTESERAEAGTDVIMTLKADTEDERYGDYLNEARVTSLVKKYSDYIRYPIVMDVEKTREGDGGPEERYTEEETLNSMIPIWQRSKSEADDLECFDFYRERFFDREDPVRVIRVSAEGSVTYKAMLFIPGSMPMGYYTREYEKGLALYASGVMIMEKCADLLPEHFRFIRGVVDSPDLSLNISREMLQHDRQLKVIASTLEKRVKSELIKLLNEDRAAYEAFYKNFGLQLKYGVVSDFGVHRDLLSDLLMFHSSRESSLTTLEEYASHMPEGQKYIYYACGDSILRIDKLPQTEQIRDAGYEILYFTDEVDEFAAQLIANYGGREFRSVTADDLGLESDENREQLDKIEIENRDLLDFLKDSLHGAVESVKLSRKLKTHPVCLSTAGTVTIEMERYFSSVPDGQSIRAQRVLEINPAHPVFDAVLRAYEADRELAAKYAEVLYAQAELIAGIPIEDPAAYTDLVCELITKRQSP